ncbi:CDP-alcohol phosphatidyltransferase family protein [Caldovatus aquaticus]|uniref:Phosphatidylcholine/phosphatidylserine synthase n=1 Tax=Caldovatus aquaticus TaxID=2865671 RepID=A0ABS7F1V4_9PROT|nr:phosphatidylcholine/phosphatidylserine synthase [Caldovatus aquaticus]MBW8268957.1 phosphatidylcholine/phosphatidylserine synthase [Caldovatus aquaticus]
MSGNGGGAGDRGGEGRGAGTEGRGGVPLRLDGTAAEGVRRGIGIRRLRRRLRPRTRPRFEGQSFNRLIPNILTLVALCAGLTAIRFALEARWEPAAGLIVFAAALDGLDGRLARLLKGTTRFGAEFDSLADFLSFGVAPALLMYLWTMQEGRGLGFVPCLLFAVCSALRLARFNAALDAPGPVPLTGPPPKPAYAQSFFTGVPAPAGAGLALFPLFAALALGGWGMPALAEAVRHPVFVGLVLVVVAALMVSTLPTWSFKNFKVPRELVLPLLLGIGLYAAFLIADPWAAMALGGLIYGGMLPFSVRSYRRLKREAEAMLEPVVVVERGAAP